MRGPNLADVGVALLAVVVLAGAGYATEHHPSPGGAAVLAAGATSSAPTSAGAAPTAAAASLAASASPAVSRTSSSILVIGDSLAKSYDATQVDLGFPELVAAALGGPGNVTETLSAIPSGTVHQLALDTTIPAGVGLTILELGTADIGVTPLHTFNVAYQQLVARIRATDPNSGLICLGTWYDPTTAGPWDTRIQADCAGPNSAYMPLSPLYSQPGTHGPKGGPTFLGRPSDAFHPTDLGHVEIARAVLAVLGVPASAVPEPSPTTSAAG